MHAYYYDHIMDTMDTVAFLEKRVRGVLRALARAENLTTPIIKGVKLRVPAL